MKNPESYYSSDQNIRFEMISAEEETALWVKARGGDVSAREFLITNHLLFAHMEAQSLSRGLLPKDEVTSAANFAVMKAFDKFDHTRQTRHGTPVRFNTYLRPFIKGEVASLWRTKFNGDIPDPSLSLFKADRSTYSYGKAVKFFEGSANDSFHNAPSGASESRGFVELSEGHSYERIDFEQFSREVVARVLAKLDPEDVVLVQKVYVDEMSFADIGRQSVPPVSRQAIEQRHGRILEKLKRLLKAENVTSAQ